LNTGSLASFIRTGSEVPVSAYSGLAAAYSLRKVVPTYTGSAIEIQSGSVSQSIGFDSFGDLNVTAIRSFAGSGDAFVKTWYDQSGNGYHASQGTLAAQPKIYSGSQGSIILENGKPALEFDGDSFSVSIPSPSTLGGFSHYLVASRASSNDHINTFGDGGISSLYAFWAYPGLGWLSRAGTGLQNYGNYNTVGQFLVSINRKASTTEMYLNNTLLGDLGNVTISTISFTNFGSSAVASKGKYQEVLLFSNNQSTNRTYIENNINSYYGIYTPTSVSTENAYVKTWYDQSGNNRHATQSVDASQPQIVSSGVIVSDGNRPAVRFDGTDDYFTFNNISTNVDYIGFQVVKKDTTNTLSIPVAGTAIGDSYLAWNYSDNSLSMRSERGQLQGATLTTTAKQLFTSLNIQTGNNTIWANGSLIITGVPSPLGGTGVMNAIGRRTAGEYGLGTTQEIIIYSSNITSSKGLIEDNINGYYNIFTQSLASGSGYVTTWYDQSGNNNHATQSVAASQPLIISSGSIYTDGNKPGVYYNGTSAWMTFSTIAARTAIAVQNAPTGPTFTFYYAIGRGNTDGALRPSTEGSSIPAYFNTGNANDFQNGGLIFVNGTTSNLTANRQHVVYAQSSANFNLSSLSSPFNSRYFKGTQQEIYIYTTTESVRRGAFEQNINNYFNIYSQPYNQNSNSLSLFSSPTVVAGAANASPTGLTTGGPEGLITVSRTGSSNYTLWKNRVPTRTTLPASTPLSNEIYLNAANVSNALFSASQNTVAYASVGAGLTDDEVYTYYELVDNLQTGLGRSKSTNPNAFITTWDTRISGTGTVSNTSSIVLPLFGTQAITASWGDGTVSLISSSAQVDRTHSYATPGIYTVSITGQGQGLQFNNGGDRNKLLDVGQWGSISGSTSGVFHGCSNLVGTAPDPHVLQTTNLSTYFTEDSKFNGFLNNWRPVSCSYFTSMLQGATVFNQPIGSWPLSASNIDMSYMFNRASSFNQDLGSWDMSRVTNIEGLFYRAFAFNNGGSPAINNWRFPTSSTVNMKEVFFDTDVFNQNIGAWNVEKVTSLYGMFSNNTGFNNGLSPDINNWRPISCSTFVNMFSAATAFNQPIGNWSISASNISMLQMFIGATAFNQNIGSWDVSKVTNMGLMLYYASAFNNSGSNTINNWRPISCSNFQAMFEGATTFNQPIGNWTIGTGSQIPVGGINMSNMFNNADAFNQNIGAWNVEKVVNMSGMFGGTLLFNNSGSSDINNWRPISCSNFSSMFNQASAFNQPIGNWPLSASNIDMGNMFRNSNYNLDLGSWDVSRVISFGSMFQQSGFNNSGSTNINNWQINTGSNVSFFQMFYQCPFNQPIGSWNVSKVTNMFSMFENNNAFNQSLENWTPISCSNFSRMFYNRVGFNGSVLNWTLPSSIAFTTDLMFSGGSTSISCKLNQDLSNWNVTKATNMSGMFGFNTSFNNSGSAGINNWTPVSCSNFSNMFLSASAFNQPVEGWTLPTDRTYTMTNMFARATSFNQPLGLWNVVSCSSMTGMLDNCGMDITNYSQTLIGWTSQPSALIPRNITLGATGRQYNTPGSASRAVLTSSPYNWTITGDTYVP